MSDFPQFSIRQLLDAGVHFGHKTMRWNPKMAPYLYGSRDNIHIIDLQQTVPMLHRALEVVADVVKNNGRVLFVGTKRQASDIVAEAAARCGQYYVNHRWLGGMMTNWNTISVSIRTLRAMEERLEATQGENPVENGVRLTKKELLELTRKHEKLNRSLGGIRDMGGRPDLLFIIDTNKEELAVKEAQRLGVPIIAVVDSNSDPDGITYPIPGNDDATRAIKLYCKLVSDAALYGIQQGLTASGVDVGAAENLVGEMSGEGNAVAAKPAARKSKTAARQAPARTKKADVAEEAVGSSVVGTAS